VVLRGGAITFEWYAPGWNGRTVGRTMSVTKSVTSQMVDQAIRDGRLPARRAAPTTRSSASTARAQRPTGRRAAVDAPRAPS
jgi:hypothetical protein